MTVAATNTHALWYLARGTGAVSLLLLTTGLVLGITTSLGWRTRRLPRFLVAGLHRSVTLLAIAFVAVHALSSVVDAYVPIRLVDVLVPFVSAYRPLWLGLGAVAFDLLLALIVTSLLRARIGVRTWRAVHWLAYAAWPVALVHGLGTGSDAHAGWLQALTVGCIVAVAATVLWRAAAASAAALPVRASAVAGALAVPVATLAWAKTGPLASGWANRAGTPSRLLAARSSGTSSLASASPATLPAGSFTASLSGRLTERNDPRGLVEFEVDASAQGGFAGRVHLALRGVPADDGGIELTDSAIGLLPVGARAWLAGRISGVEGSRLVTRVAGREVVFDLTTDSATGSVTGTLEAAGRGSEG